MEMKIDKKNGNIAYNDEFHTYWEDGTDIKYISVTTLISKFEQPYDKEFWSAYKAFEKIAGDAFKIEKRGLLSTRKFDKESILIAHGIDENLFNKTQQDILDDWDKKNKESCERGTAIHAKLENAMYGRKDINLSKYNIGGKFECKKNYNELNLEHAVYPEYLIYYKDKDGVIKLAGQIDLLVKNGNEIFICDYKTNNEIKMKSGFDVASRTTAKMKFPLNTLDDCNYWHYNMQLSTYAWMVQQLNPDFIIKDLVMIHFDHNNKMTVYHLDYLKDEVEKMLKYYKKEIMLEDHRNKRKKIIY